MVYTHYQGLVKEQISKMNLTVIAMVLAFAGLVGIAAFAVIQASAAVTTINGCDFDDNGAGTWSLQSDCTSTAQINIPTGTTLEGNGFTINASFPKTSNSNNSAIGVQSNNVTINDLKIDGTGGSAYPLGLHGINVYVATGINLNDVSIKNMTYTGLLVNGSSVTVNNISTSGNGWSGINVDQGSGVVSPALLTVNGVSLQTDTAQIYVDHYLSGVRDVVDTNSQYSYVDNPVDPNGYTNDRLYTLKYPRNAEITSPLAGSTVSGSVVLAAYLDDDDADNIQWAMRAGTCAAGTGTVFGNVDGKTNVATIDQTDLSNQTFSFSVDTTTVEDGAYCFVYNPTEDSGETNIRLTREFTVDNRADNKAECENGGWMLGLNLQTSFRNQGDCVSYFATGGANPPTNGATNERANRNR